MIAHDNQVKSNRGRKPFEIPKGMKVDWTKNNRELAEQLDTTPLTIMKLRLRLGKKPLPRGRPYDNATVPAYKIKEATAQLQEVRKTVNALFELFAKK